MYIYYRPGTLEEDTQSSRLNQRGKKPCGFGDGSLSTDGSMFFGQDLGHCLGGKPWKRLFTKKAKATHGVGGLLQYLNRLRAPSKWIFWVLAEGMLIVLG